MSKWNKYKLELHNKIEAYKWMSVEPTDLKELIEIAEKAERDRPAPKTPFEYITGWCRAPSPGDDISKSEYRARMALADAADHLFWADINGKNLFLESIQAILKGEKTREIPNV